MKKIILKVCVTAFSASLFLCGCQKKADNTNIQKGMELIEQYDYQGALESFEAALLYDEDKQLLNRGLGLAYMGLGDYAAAETAFLESVSFAGGNLGGLEYDTNYYLATAYFKQGKYKEAQEIYSAIIAMKKKETDAYYLRACSLLKQENYEEAKADFEKAFSLEPNNLELVTDAFVEMQAAGFTEEGRTYLQEFLQKKEKSIKDGDRGIIYYYLEDYANARTYLDSFMNGSDPEMSLILGKTYEKLGDMNYATSVYQTYLESNEPDAAIYNSLGICFMNQKKYQEAQEVFKSGIDMGESAYLQNLRFNYIVANEYLGNFEQSKSLMEEYLKAYPDDANAKREYEFLQTR